MIVRGHCPNIQLWCYGSKQAPPASFLARYRYSQVLENGRGKLFSSNSLNKGLIFLPWHDAPAGAPLNNTRDRPPDAASKRVSRYYTTGQNNSPRSLSLGEGLIIQSNNQFPLGSLMFTAPLPTAEGIHLKKLSN